MDGICRDCTILKRFKDLIESALDRVRGILKSVPDTTIKIVSSDPQTSISRVEIRVQFELTIISMNKLAESNLLLLSTAFYIFQHGGFHGDNHWYFQHFRALSKQRAEREGLSVHPMVLSNYCCSWRDTVEGVTLKVFEQNHFKPVRFVELGTREGSLGYNLLMRFPWIQYFGVDAGFEVQNQPSMDDLYARFRPFKDRSQLLIPMLTDEAFVLFKQQGLNADVVLADARFTNDNGSIGPHGMLADVRNWNQILNKNGCLVFRDKVFAVVRMFSDPGFIENFGRRIGSVHMTTISDSDACFFCMLD